MAVLDSSKALPELGIFFFLLVVFLISPVAQVTDSSFSLLVSQCLYETRSFDLGSYRLPLPEGQPKELRSLYPLPRQLVKVHGRVRYAYPLGSSLLSVPFVALLSPFGLAPADGTGLYSEAREIRCSASWPRS